jgi:DtxR family Mn-dependent transcriptional regulator
LEFGKIDSETGPEPRTLAVAMSDQPTSAVQDYLKAIHLLGGAERPVPPAEIAVRLQVRAPSVTGMLKRLAEAGYID